MTRHLFPVATLSLALALGCGDAASPSAPVPPAASLTPAGRTALRGSDLTFDLVASGKTLTIQCIEGNWGFLRFTGSDEELKAVVFEGQPPTLQIRSGRISMISLNFEQIKLYEGGCDSPGKMLLAAPGPGVGRIYIDDIIIGIATYTGARGLLLPAVY